MIAKDRDNPDGGATSTRATENTEDDGFNIGGIGLLGLAGLAVLMPRKQVERHTTDTGTGATTSRN